MADKIHWGIIGCGSIAAKFAEGLGVLADAELTAVGSRTEKKAHAFAKEHNATRAHGSYERLAEDPNVDVVYVATPHPFHMENTILCLEHGKAVLCEKPFAMNARQAERMIDTAENKGLFLMEAMWTRFLPMTRKICQIVKEGMIGDVRFFQADFGYRTPWDPQHRALDPVLGGGALLDVGIYPISYASMLFDSQPANITSQGHIGKTGVDEQSTYLFSYDNGQLAALFSAVRTRTSWEAVIAGTDGMIKIHSPFWRAEKATLVTADNEEVLIEEPLEGNGYNYQAAEVHDCLRQGKLQSEIMPLTETLAIMEILDKIRQQWQLNYPCE